MDSRPIRIVAGWGVFLLWLSMLYTLYAYSFHFVNTSEFMAWLVHGVGILIFVKVYARFNHRRPKYEDEPYEEWNRDGHYGREHG